MPAPIAILVQIAHQARVVILVLADDAEVRVRASAEFAEQVARA